jgi:hypothetical protein
MPRSHGKQKSAAKQKKRRQERRQERAFAAPGPSAGAPSAKATPPRPGALELYGYDADLEIEATPWAELAEAERLARVKRYHEGTLAPGKRPPSMERHAGLHVLVESQLATGVPPQAPAALRRLRAEGMSRHDAIHALGWLATEHVRRALEAQRPLDDAAYAADLDALTIQRWLALAGIGR